MRVDDFFGQLVNNRIGGRLREEWHQADSETFKSWESGDEVGLFRLARKDNNGIMDGEAKVILYDNMTSVMFAGSQEKYYEREILNSFFYGLMRGWKLRPYINSTLRVASCQVHAPIKDDDLNEVVTELENKDYKVEVFDVRGDGKDNSKLITALFADIREDM